MIPFAPSQPDSPREECDWRWCYENPNKAAAEIISLERRLQEAQREHAEWMLMHGWELESALRKAGDAQRELKRVEATTYDSMLTLKAERDAALREVEEHKRDAERWRVIAEANLAALKACQEDAEIRDELHAALAEKGKP